MKKGITPIIAIIILLLITMALAATAWAFLSSYLDTMIGTSFQIPLPEKNSVWCTCTGDPPSCEISVYISNMSPEPINPSTDLDLCTLDGADCSDDLVSTTIQPESGKVALITSADAGSHTVVLGAASTVQSADVTCA